MNAERSEYKQEKIRQIAETIYAESKNKGLANDPERDWKEAESIYDDKLKYYLWWLPLQYFLKNKYKIYAVGGALFIFLIVSGIQSYRNSADLNTRPYLSLDIIQPMQIVDEGVREIYYGTYIILRNNGKTPASNVSAQYYMTTNIDRERADTSKWFNERIGGLGTLSFIAPGAIYKEAAFRSLSPTAKYYYFEAIAAYEGLKPEKKFWTSIKKVFYIDRETGNFYPLHTQGDWDRNKNFSPPSISDEKEIAKLLQETKKIIK